MDKYMCYGKKERRRIIIIRNGAKTIILQTTKVVWEICVQADWCQMHHTYRNIVIEYRVVSNIVDYTIDVPLQFSNLFKKKTKQKMGSTCPSKHMFLISPVPSRIPRLKIEKKIESVWTNFIY